ncbi:MAG: AI-2E family transporter [Desulfobacteraceae bacterium]|jgi:predicted PurR-regulated permease PerM|nr:AI-2E family transporter [Desulfobacteraceae bacterium]
MSFDLQHFFKINKKIVIWAAFFGLLFLVRKVFGLVFLTFILCYIFNNAIVSLERRLGFNRHFWTIFVYLLFVAVVTALFFIGLPSIIAETKLFFTQLPDSVDAFHNYLDRLTQRQHQLQPVLEGFKETVSIKNLLGISRDALLDFVVGFFNRIGHFGTYFLLATLFSFLILFDFPHLRERVLALRETRFRDVYDETADSVAKYALAVGYTFQAQIGIAILNTILTTIGIVILGIGAVTLLSSIVFFAGLIPVWGTFISSIPILLLAFNDGGLALGFKAAGMIVLVHIVEAYILNPRIVSAVFKINPLLTLIILYLGHSLFGMWGVLLGVPTAVYVYRHIILKPPNGAEQIPLQVDQNRIPSSPISNSR